MWPCLIRLLRALALGWVATFGPAVVMAQALPFQIESAYAQESSETSSPDDLARLTFTAYEGELIQAFPAAATWIRLTITPRKAPHGAPDAARGDDAYTLRVGPNNLQQVDLFEPSSAGWSRRTDRGFHSNREHPCLDGRHCFKLERFDGSARTFYLRILYPGARRVSFEVLGPKEILATAVDQIRTVTRAITVGFCMLCLSVYLLLVVDRSALMLTFVLFQVSIMVSTFSMTGHLGGALMGAAVDLSLVAFGSIVSRTLMILLLCLTTATFAADPQLIRVVFENLLKNASTYGLADEPIELSVGSQPDGWMRIDVSNGVAPGAMPDPDQIFTRYYRHTQSQIHPGMGIGLSLVRSTILKIGGSIEYHPGKQCLTFTIRIPR